MPHETPATANRMARKNRELVGLALPQPAFAGCKLLEDALTVNVPKGDKSAARLRGVFAKDGLERFHK